ncbi:Uncharacterized protein TCM_038369 [Theobroma cacao]|uniref:Uncharacterized protein n=1 Tax=Theobroma cacao TaxID=3641 RepID=A0A061GPH4_THECC|nr:Uncharacterized protein TCM_038369 [Theobroma cacao]
MSFAGLIRRFLFLEYDDGNALRATCIYQAGLKNRTRKKCEDPLLGFMSSCMHWVLEPCLRVTVASSCLRSPNSSVGNLDWL